MSARRTLGVVAAVALTAAGGGYLVAQQMHAPADELALAEPPEPGPVTAMVELRTIESEVVVRGDMVFAGALDVTVDVSGLRTSAVVTGVPVGVDDAVTEGSVLAVVADRPVIVLGGDVPAYRTITASAEGDDVRQLEAALARLGLEAGPVDGRYDAATAEAVEALYAQLGYPAPQPPDELTTRLVAAEQAVDAAEERLRVAQAALAEAVQPPARSEVLAADVAIAAARRAIDAAKATGDKPAQAEANEQLLVAQAQRDELATAPDTTAEQDAIDAATAARDLALTELAEADEGAATPVPASELAFVPHLPRRVDELAVERGDTVDGPIARLSGAELVARSELGSADRRLVALGDPVIVEGAGLTLGATIAGFDDDAETGSSVATITLDDPTAEQVAALAGLNVKLVVPIDATDGEVLAVPLAALSAAGDGSSRVEVADADGTTEMVEVDVGLVADGVAEVRASDDRLQAGDEVVVGR